jgi:hypothetical protein
MGQAGFWDNNEKAQATVAELKSVNSVLKPLEEALAVGSDLEALEELAREDQALEGELAQEADRLAKLVDALELTSLLSGTHDAADALVSINARDGGTDANDWAEMLLRMYSAWASKHDYEIELQDRAERAAAEGEQWDGAALGEMDGHSEWGDEIDAAMAVAVAPAPVVLDDDQRERFTTRENRRWAREHHSSSTKPSPKPSDAEADK